MRIEGANVSETKKGERENAIESTESNETREFMARKIVKRKPRSAFLTLSHSLNKSRSQVGEEIY